LIVNHHCITPPPRRPSPYHHRPPLRSASSNAAPLWCSVGHLLLSGVCTIVHGSLRRRTHRRLVTRPLPPAAKSPGHVHAPKRRCRSSVRPGRAPVALSWIGPATARPSGSGHRVSYCQATRCFLAVLGVGRFPTQARPRTRFQPMAPKVIFNSFSISKNDSNFQNLYQIQFLSKNHKTSFIIFLNSCSIQEKYKT
jgi:hypothetical protein